MSTSVTLFNVGVAVAPNFYQIKTKAPSLGWLWIHIWSVRHKIHKDILRSEGKQINVSFHGEVFVFLNQGTKSYNQCINPIIL